MKEQLQHIFQNSYPGSDVFIDKVLKPIFSDDVITNNDIDIIDSPDKRRRADNANIFSAIHVADIDRVDSDPIALYDVTLRPGSKIQHSRVAIKQFIASEAMSFTHAFILFHYDNEPERPWRFSYVYKERTTAATRATAKRYTYVFGKDYRSRTAVERFLELARSSKTDKDFAEAFSVEALSDEFFDRYRELYADFVQYITGKRYVKESGKWVEKTIHAPNPQLATSFEGSDKLVRDYIKKMFGRIVFLYFLQRKGWLAGNRQYMHDLFYHSELQDNFLDGVLEPLFFGVLNTRSEHRSADVAYLPDSDKIPYLNGGLFQQDEIDERTCTIPADYFKRLFDFFDQYNFTIDENDPEDAEVGIDPEMLGRIFENLLEDNKDKGAFYTPKEIVEYMCRESIMAYLLNGIPERSHELIRNFVETLDADSLNDEQRKYLAKKLVDVKICDPAIGSGAFPMGIVNILSKIYLALGLVRDRSKMKRHIMEQNIYGVDIEKGAVDIARLRFWLAMVVDATDPEPLPNLHFKIMQGNSLMESYNGKDLSRLTKINIGEPGSLGLQNQDAELLISSLAKYYSESDHGERAKIFNDILNNVRRQIFELTQSEEFMKDINDLSANDKFFLWHTWFADVFANGGFDIIIGNPPYLKEGRANKAIFEAVKDSPYYQGKMDIWYMFACLGIDMLKSDGNLCFIATNNWVTSSGAKKLRQKINTDAQIIQLCDFKDYMIFKTASIQTMIMQFKKNKAAQSYQFDLRNLLGTELEDVVQLLNKEHSPTTQYLEPTYNRLEMRNKFITFSDSEDLFMKIRQRSDAIFLENKEIAQGIVFPQDFLNKKGQQILGHHKVGDGIFGLTNQELSNLNLPEYEMVLIKPYYTTEQVKRYFTLTGANTQWLIYTDSTYKDESSMDSFPVLKAHLDQFRPIFTSDNKPYGLHRARDPRFFSGSKIICQRKCAELPIFSYSDGECYLTQTFNIIKTNRVNLKYLTGLLNSKLIAFWLRNRGKMQGSNYQLDKEPLQQIPIPVPEIEVQTRIGHLVDEIIVRKSANENASIQDVENQIDNIVYHLYDLTYDEVLIVDSNTPITREQYESFNLETYGQP
ncbi:N-6 DNA methylase [uncultured Bacteroides sp.]|uniref:Eco57I restriction-modification methylase domain-containing protein n=1 Tax=uncultured Bacteroides sp. TaxID=162156 RepID=UPI00266EE64B|nr:N-6 DNA methylase [uncultured Bacteroides sp.]